MKQVKRSLFLNILAASVICTGSASAAPDIVVKYFSVEQPTWTNPMSLSVSADGRFVAYRSGSTPTSLRYANVMILDVVTGERIQANKLQNGSLPVNAQCDVPKISADSRYTAFSCVGTEMGVNTPGGVHAIFVYDRIENKTEVLPFSSNDRAVAASMVAITGDGHYVAYRTTDGTNGKIWLRNMIAKTTTFTNAPYAIAGASPGSIHLSDDGRYIGYLGRFAVSSGVPDVWWYDRSTGASEAIDINPAGVRSKLGSYNSIMSSDGTVFAFVSSDTGLVTPAAKVGGVYVRDRISGHTELVSGIAAAGFVTSLAMSADGRFVAFTGNPIQSVKNMYVYDRLTKVTRVVPGAIGYPTTAQNLSLSATGRYLTWESGDVKAFTRAIGYADLGDTAGVILSPPPELLVEGGTQRSYSVVLTRVPDAEVKVSITPDNQLSVNRTELVFAPENWNVPQFVAVGAREDGVAEATQDGKITHVVSSTDVEYTVVSPITLAIPVKDAVVPTIGIHSKSWRSSDLPLSGTAMPEATVIVTATNRTTGTLISVSTVAGQDGKWSCILRGLTDGVVDLDARADGIASAVTTIDVVLTQP